MKRIVLPVLSQRFVIGLLALGMLAGAATAWALELKLPNRRAKAKVMLLVDEAGRTLFATQPGLVEVTNLPAEVAVTGQVEVTNFPQAEVTPPARDEFVSFYVQAQRIGPMDVFDVPVDRVLIITDVLGP
jgi:hypothetical protein